MTATIVDHLELLRSRAAAALESRLGEHLGRLSWDAQRLAEHRRERLRALLAHAIEHSPFHARRLAGADLERFELADLEALPVMTKAEMMSAYDDVVTDRRLGRALVEEHLASCTEEPRLLLDDYVCLASGGSSGMRGIFAHTIDEYADFGASLMRRAIARALAAGGAGGPVQIAMVGAASPIHSTGFAGAMVTGGMVRFASVPATLPLQELVARLNALQPPMLQGYPTKLAELAAEQRAGRLRIAPRAIVVTSEMLTAEDRAAIESAFGLPVVDQFASTEGLAGQSEPGEPVLTFAGDMCIAEPVDEDNRPVPDGATSAKVLVTNLHNLTQPLIRYELSDRFTCHGDADGHLRATVEGRADEVFRYGDVEVHPIAIRTVLVKEPAIREYQVRQTATGLEAAIVTDGDVDETALAHALEASLAKAGVPEPQAIVRVAGEIERHPETGKTKRFVAR